MSRIRLIRQIAVSYLAGMAVAQDPKATEAVPAIRGVVFQAGTQRPLAAAEVALFRMSAQDSQTLASMSKTEAAAKTSTGADGRFELRPDQFGSFGIRVTKEGWIPAGSPLKGTTTFESVSISKDHPSRELKLSLAQPGGLTGSVTDEESGQPVAGRALMAWQIVYHAGRRVGSPTVARTAEDGTFAFKLPPGDYLIQIAPRIRGRERLQVRVGERDRQQVDRDYEATYWPGKLELESAFPVTIGSGAVVSVGRLRVRTTPHYRVHASVEATGCGPEDLAQIGLRSSLQATTERLGEVPCGTEFLVTGVEPGTYRLSAYVEKSGSPISGSASFTIKDKAAEVSIPLARGVELEVRVVAPEGGKFDFKRVRLRLRPVDGIGPTSASLLGPPDAEGKFRIPSLEVGEHQIVVYGIGGAYGYCVQEIHYNRVPVPDRILRVNGQSMSHLLEIVVGDKPATISGTVGDADHRARRPHVLLAKWPVVGNVYNAVLTSAGDEDGRFQISGLSAGEYRILAVMAEDKDALDEPNVLERILARGEKIILSANGFQNVRLEPANPRR